MITGLPEHLRNYSLAVFDYFATGEGFTLEAQILNDNDELPMDIGWWDRNLIPRYPCVIEKESHGEKYLDWNPEFKMHFYQCFGVKMWNAFVHCCERRKSVLDLKVKMHYNLS